MKIKIGRFHLRYFLVVWMHKLASYRSDIMLHRGLFKCTETLAIVFDILKVKIICMYGKDDDSP